MSMVNILGLTLSTEGVVETFSVLALHATLIRLDNPEVGVGFGLAESRTVGHRDGGLIAERSKDLEVEVEGLVIESGGDSEAGVVKHFCGW